MRCFMQVVPDLSIHNLIFICLEFNSAHVVGVQRITKTKKIAFKGSVSQLKYILCLPCADLDLLN